MLRLLAANRAAVAGLLACFMLSLTSLLAAQERTWTDVDGRTMRAEFIREVDGEVSFLQGNKLITLPLTRLSEADRQHIRQVEASRANPDARPAEKPPEPSPFIDRGNSAIFEEMR